MAKVVIHTDGACSGNPGPGGWGAILVSGQHRKELKGGEVMTTNNRMELTAAIQALESLKGPSQVELYTDSAYLRGGITSWIKSWRKNGWRTADKKPVRNAELWQRLELAEAPHQISWHWVKAHDGNVDNDRADELAREGMAPFLRAAEDLGPKAELPKAPQAVSRPCSPRPRRASPRYLAPSPRRPPLA